MTALPSVQSIAEAVNTGAVDALFFARDCLSRIADRTELNAVIATVPPEGLAAPAPGGRLAGVPLLVKDILDVAGWPTTSGARGTAPVASRHAVTVQSLVAEGAVVIGKANLHPYAWGVTSQNPNFGDVVNPRHPDHTPGGSSGGNAAALAVDLCALALGTDTGGSARMPAACCEIVGFKPETGLLSVRGVRPLAPSLDCVGPMARTLEDCLLAADVLGAGGSDRFPGTITLGVVDDFLPRDVLINARTRIATASFPEMPGDVAAIFDYEVAEQHLDRARVQPDAYTAEQHAKLAGLRRMSVESYRAALAERVRWRAEVEATMVGDVLLTPTLGGPVPARGAWEPAIRDELGRYCRVINNLGWSAIALGNLMVTGPRTDLVVEAARRLDRAAGMTPYARPVLAADSDAAIEK